MMLDCTQLQKQIERACPQAQVQVVSCTGSTNVDLMARRQALINPTQVLLALEQTAGRGRAGRVWQSAAGASILFSVGIALPPIRLEGMSLAVGLAAQQTLLELGVATQLKWPNDILFNGKKMGGVLLQSSFNADGYWLVAGVGINFAPFLTAKILPKTAHNHQTHKGGVSDASEESEANNVLAQALPTLTYSSYCEAGGQHQFSHVASALCQGVLTGMERFATHGFAPLMLQWNAVHAHAHQAVQIWDDAMLLKQGMALGVNQQGALLLQTAQGVETIMAGDVSLRTHQIK